MPTALSSRLHGLRFLAAALLLTGVATAGCARTSTVVSSTADPAPLFALRLAFNDSASGREPVQYGDATFFLAPEVLLSDDDVLSVSTMTQPDGRLLLHVRHRPESAQRLVTTTARHVGDHVAVVLDSRVWSLAAIAGPIGGSGSITIATSAAGKDADRIALRVRSRWPAR
jgi:preprotein translocase subunit SecD